MPTRPGPAGRARRAPACGVEIRGRRDLHVRRIAGDDVHGVPGMLGEHRLVGGLDTAAVAPDRPRRWRPSARTRRKACGVCARKISSRGSVATITLEPGSSVGATRLTVSLTGTATIAAPCATAAVDRARDDVGRHERPRGIVHEHDLGVGRHRLARVGHGILPAGAAFDDAHAVEPASAARPRAIDGQRHDHVGHGRVGRERLHAPLRASTSRPRPATASAIGAEPASGSARGDDGRHVHLGRVCGGSQTAIHSLIPAPELTAVTTTSRTRSAMSRAP